MGRLATAAAYCRDIAGARSPDDLRFTLAAIARDMGFDHFALTHHIDIKRASHGAIRLHDYPDDWVEFFDDQRLGTCDPVHRASHVTSVGFAWAEVPRLITMTAGDHRILALAREHGLGEGFTVPAHVPGEARGSCSFASRYGRQLPTDILPLAQLAGAFAFEGARRLWRADALGPHPLPVLTDRQRDCLVWVARGKSDWEVSRILGISHETVTRHVKEARGRYGMDKRTPLVIRALFDGTISFNDIFRR